MRHAVLLLTLAACGRVGFEEQRLGVLDAPGDSTGTDASTACGAPGLVLHLRFDETSGTAVQSSVGASSGVWHDGDDNTISAEAVPGRVGGAFQFGTGRYVTVPSFRMPSEGTFAAWLSSTFDDTTMPSLHPMVIDAPSPRTTISYAGDIASYGLRTNNVSWQATYMPPTDLTSWFHLAAVWSSAGAQLYIDGVPRGSGVSTDARSTSPVGLYVGTREQVDRWWFGLIDDVRIYDRPLTEAEILMILGCP